MQRGLGAAPCPSTGSSEAPGKGAAGAVGGLVAPTCTPRRAPEPPREPARGERLVAEGLRALGRGAGGRRARWAPAAPH